jgi:hypothetical protein
MVIMQTTGLKWVGLDDITERKDIDVEMIPLEHTAGTCVRACSALTELEEKAACIQNTYTGVT